MKYKQMYEDLKKELKLASIGSEVDSQIIEKHEKEIEKLESSLSSKDDQVENLEIKLDHFKTLAESRNSEIHKLFQQYKDVVDDRDSLLSKIETLEIENGSLQRITNVYIKENGELKTEFDACSSSLKSAERALNYKEIRENDIAEFTAKVMRNLSNDST